MAIDGDFTLDPIPTDPPVTTPVPDGVLPADTGSASNAFILWACALVFLMTPGLALFYSGLSRYNSALSLMMWEDVHTDRH